MSNSPTTETETYRIPSNRVAELDEKVQKLNRRAARLGMPPIGYQMVGEEITKDEDGYVLVWKLVEMTGEAPVVEGHTFVARIEHTEAGNIMSKAPGAREVVIPESIRDGAACCDHCRTNRRRNDTFLLRVNATGELTRIGRNCLADYLRTTDPAGAISIFTLLYQLRSSMREMESEGWGGGGFAGYVTASVVATAISVIRAGGWTSSARAREEDKASTASIVGFALGKSPQDGRSRAYWDSLQPVQEDYTAAGNVVEWAKSLTGTSDYEHNLKVACSLSYVMPKNVALVVSAVPTYRRAMEQAEASRAPARVDTGHFGSVGQRCTMTLTVKATRCCESAYGVTTLVVFEDAEGHTFKWFASGPKSFETGATVTVKGTIKGHGEYKGHKETMLTRCSVS